MEYKKGIESSHIRKSTSSDGCGHWRQEHRGVGPYYTLSCPHSRSRVQHSVRGHTREVRWTVTPREGKDSDSSDSRKPLFLWFDFSYRFFWISFSLISSSVVVVDFIGSKKSSSAFELLFFFLLSHIFYCCYKPLPLCWAFAILFFFFNINLFILIGG